MRQLKRGMLIALLFVFFVMPGSLFNGVWGLEIKNVRDMIAAVVLFGLSGFVVLAMLVIGSVLAATYESMIPVIKIGLLMMLLPVLAFVVMQIF